MGRLSLPDRDTIPASGDLVEDRLVRMGSESNKVMKRSRWIARSARYIAADDG